MKKMMKQNGTGTSHRQPVITSHRQPVNTFHYHRQPVNNKNRQLHVINIENIHVLPNIQPDNTFKIITISLEMFGRFS